jgi:predicted transcriptional regulator
MGTLKNVIGPNQRRILKMLRTTSELTEADIASKLYEKPVKVGSFEYAATSKSLTGLLKKGLVERSESKVTWHLPETKSMRKNHVYIEFWGSNDIDKIVQNLDPWAVEVELEKVFSKLLKKKTGVTWR